MKMGWIELKDAKLNSLRLQFALKKKTRSIKVRRRRNWINFNRFFPLLSSFFFYLMKTQWMYNLEKMNELNLYEWKNEWIKFSSTIGIVRTERTRWWLSLLHIMKMNYEKNRYSWSCHPTLHTDGMVWWQYAPRNGISFYKYTPSPPNRPTCNASLVQQRDEWLNDMKMRFSEQQQWQQR